MTCERLIAYLLLYHEGFTWNLVKKNPNILAFKFDHFPTSLYRVILLKADMNS